MEGWSYIYMCTDPRMHTHLNIHTYGQYTLGYSSPYFVTTAIYFLVNSSTKQQRKLIRIYLQGRQLYQKMALLSCQHMATRKGKNLLSRKQILYFKRSPAWCTGKQSESHKSCLPLTKWPKIYYSHTFSLNA